MSMHFASVGQTKNGGNRRPPLILFTELAEEFGISPGSLLGQMRNSKVVVPKRVGQTSGHSVKPMKTYYEAKPMRDWWKAHNEAKESA
jgi:hypothetical protein